MHEPFVSLAQLVQVSHKCIMSKPPPNPNIAIPSFLQARLPYSIKLANWLLRTATQTRTQPPQIARAFLVQRCVTQLTFAFRARSRSFAIS